jgi:hypothetical protein
VPIGEQVWGDTVIRLAPLGNVGAPLHNELASEPCCARGSGAATVLAAADALGRFPVALLTLQLSRGQKMPKPEPARLEETDE